jgi:hypothetical protein
MPKHETPDLLCKKCHRQLPEGYETICAGCRWKLGGQRYETPMVMARKKKRRSHGK